MTHRCLILSLSAVLACGASTVRADRRLPRPANEYSANRLELKPYQQVDWEILAGCPECVMPTKSPRVNRERPATVADAGRKDAKPLYGNDLAMEINRLNDGLADAPEPELYGDALAREINCLNDGLHHRVAQPTPRPGFRAREIEAALASRKSDSYEADTYHQILGARGQWIFVSTDSPLGRKIRELVQHETARRTAAAPLDLEIYTPCAGDLSVPYEAAEVNLPTSGSRTSFSSVDAADAAFNDPHCADPVFDAEVVAGGSAADAARRGIASIEPAVPQADAVPLPVAECGKRSTAFFENAELRWEMNHRADVRVNDCQLDGTVGRVGVARLRVRQVAENPNNPATTIEALTGIVQQIVLPVKQAGGQIATGTARAVQGVLETVYQARGEAARHAQRAVPYRGL